MSDAGRFLKSAFAALTPDEALRHATATLLGVSQSAQNALGTIGINTVFDLAASRSFATAKRLLEIQNDPTAAEARLNAVATDAVDAPAGVPAMDLADQSIAILHGIGAAHADAVSAALDIATVRDLALWPPHSAAKALLDLAYFPQKVSGFDVEAPADLLPKSGVYPTERVFFKKLVIDTIAIPGDGVQALEQAQPIDLASALGAPTGFGHFATGALLTFSQSWFSQGLALGQLLHSATLAPGESTRIAVIDWSRRTRAAASEDISESELLSNAMSHSRAISEVTSATASEFQSGSSTVTSDSTTGQAGGGFGLDLGPLAIGGSGGISNSNTTVTSTSSSFGARDLAANYAQDINDRSQQNASSVRNRRASIVREVSQEEHEQISTRVITNYNHMHALSIQYFEVVQAFRATTMLERAERCLFIPIKLMDFSDPALVDRWRLVLADAALTDRARRQLTVEYGVVEIIPQTPRVTPGSIITSGIHNALALSLVTTTASFTAPVQPPSGQPTPGAGTPGSPDGSTPAAAGATAPATTLTDYTRAPINAPAALLALKGWNADQLNRIGWTTGRVLMQAGSDSVFVSDDVLLIGFSLRGGTAARFVARTHDGHEIAPASATGTDVAFAAPVPITDLDSVSVQFVGAADLKTSLVLQLNLLGTVMPLDVPIMLRPESVPREVVKFGSVRGARELIDHLQANRLHYTQAIMRSLDAATVAALLGRFTYRGLPLGMLVDSQPFAVTANFLVFKLNVATGAEPSDSPWAEEQTAWQNWLARRGLDRPVPRSEVIPLPSGGLFAEAVLGRYNAAEKLDLARFWNWQDSPIPIIAPDIAAVQAGSRAQPENLTPGQLSQPVLNIQAPTALPDPTGIGAIISAIQQGNMFRDMSGLAQSAALAQAALQATASGATAAGAQAGQNMKAVVDAQTERIRIKAQMATQMAALRAGGAGASGGVSGRAAKNVTEEGARLNYARAMDTRRADGAGLGGTVGGRTSAATGAVVGGTGEATDLASPQFAPGGDLTAPQTYEGDLFNRDTGGAEEDLANQTLAYSGDGGGVGGDVSAAARPSKRPAKRRTTTKPPSDRTFQLEFNLGLKEGMAGREPGSYKCTVAAGADILDEGWTRIPPDNQSWPGTFYSRSNVRSFKSSSSQIFGSVTVFPIHFDTVSEADMQQAALTGSIDFALPLAGDILIKVWVTTGAKSVLVPAGQTLEDILKTHGPSPHLVTNVSDPKPIRNPLTNELIATMYDVVFYFKDLVVSLNQPKLSP
jgi:hypothetical protein